MARCQTFNLLTFNLQLLNVFSAADAAMGRIPAGVEFEFDFDGLEAAVGSRANDDFAHVVSGDTTAVVVARGEVVVQIHPRNNLLTTPGTPHTDRKESKVFPFSSEQTFKK